MMLWLVLVVLNKIWLMRPASISIITKEELEKKPIKDIGEAIGDIPGVDVTMNKTGTYDFSIRGFGSSYTLVLIDGKRQSVANGFYDNGFSGSESGYLPPLSMIERIEVIVVQLLHFMAVML